TKQSPRAKILVISGVEDIPLTRDLASLGIKGHIVEASSATHLVEAIETLHRGDSFLCPVLTRAVLTQQYPGQQRADGGLSERDVRLLRWVAEGKTNMYAAAQLGLSVRTVEAQRARLMKKLGLRTVAGLTQYAITRGLLKPS